MRNLHYKDTRTLYNNAISYTIIASYLFTYLFHYYYLYMHTLLTITIKKTPLTERKITQL